MNRRWIGSRRIKLLKLIEAVDIFTKPVFECNACGRRVRHPIDSPRHVSPAFEEYGIVGGGFRLKEQCPFCLSNDRLRFSIEVLRRFTDIFSRPFRALEFAPIRGMEVYLKAHGQCDYVSGDIAHGAAMRVIDITDIDMPDDAFDLVLCSHVLEHIEDEKSALSELRRVLRPGGTLLLSVPVALKLPRTLEDKSADTAGKRLAEYGQKDHVRLYGLDIKERLEGCGMRVQEIVAREAMPDAVARYGLIPEDRNYICKKA